MDNELNFRTLWDIEDFIRKRFSISYASRSDFSGMVIEHSYMVLMITHNDTGTDVLAPLSSYLTRYDMGVWVDHNPFISPHNIQIAFNTQEECSNIGRIKNFIKVLSPSCDFKIFYYTKKFKDEGLTSTKALQDFFDVGSTT